MADERAPETIEEARRRTVERLRQQAASDHAPVARRSNGQAPAPDHQVNWALVIGEMAAQQELSCRRQIEAVKEELIALAANKSGGISDSEVSALVTGLAKAIKPWVAEQIRAAAPPPPKAETHRGTEWICSEPTTNDNGRSCDECGSCGPRMRGGPILLNSVWLSIAKRPEEFLCITCMQVRCRERLGRELGRNDLRGCDANRSWSVVSVPRSERVTRIERDADGNFVPVYDDPIRRTSA